MTVSTELSHEEYVGSGVTTDFDFRFRIFESKHLIVVVADSEGNETTLKNGTDYTIVGAGSYHGGKVVLNKPLAQGWKILLERDLPVVQETDLRNQGKFFAEVHEDAFDYLTMLIQKALGTFSLSLRKPTYLSNYYDAKGNRIANLAPPKLGTDSANKDYVDNSIKYIDSKTLRVKDKAIPALPSAEQRANKILAFDDKGQPITVLPESGSASDVLIELAKPTGSKLIGFGQTTVDEKLKEIKSVIDYGVKGDGSDESLKLQDAINSGSVIVPDGIRISVSDITIPKGTIFKFGKNSELHCMEVDSIKFEADKKYLVNPSDVGTSTVIKLQDAIPNDAKFIKVYRPYNQSQAWYDQYSTDPKELGYTADIYRVESISGNDVTLRSQLEFTLDKSSFVTLINGKTTKFYNGHITSKDKGNYMFAHWGISDVIWYGTEFTFGSGGIRFNNSTNIYWYYCKFNNPVKGYSISLNYGTTDCLASNCVFYGGLVSDAQYVTFAGCRRINSVRNHYYLDKDETTLSGFYIGAKCIDCKSIDDTFNSGRYGVCIYYGAQHAQVIRPSLINQSVAGIHGERSQYFHIEDPYIKFSASLGVSDLTWGAIVIRDCDEYAIDAEKIPILAKERMLSIHTTTSRGQTKSNITIMVKGTGSVSISSLMEDSYIRINTDSYISIYQNEGVMNRIHLDKCVAKYIQLWHMSYSIISKCRIIGDGATTAIQLQGNESKWNEFKGNYFDRHSKGIQLEATNIAKFTNSIHDDNMFVNVETKITNKVLSTDSPLVPYTISRIPQIGFKLYVTEQYDSFNLARSIRYFRHSGKNSGKKSDWFKVTIDEVIMSD